MAPAPILDLTAFLPEGLGVLRNPQTGLPAIAKDAKLVGQIEQAVHRIPTVHDLHIADARAMAFLEPESRRAG